MTRDDLTNRYFEWLCDIVYNEEHSDYQKLLTYLHQTAFSYLIEMDGNRAADGIDLRYRFGNLMGYAPAVIAEGLDMQDCSVLEMMVALSVRCEEDITNDPDKGNRVGYWFWSMVRSLGLERMTDTNFDRQRTDKIIAAFLNRRYLKNGKGGLFTVEGSKYDLRRMEIWYQMCLYLDTVLYGRKV